MKKQYAILHNYCSNYSEIIVFFSFFFFLENKNSCKFLKPVIDQNIFGQNFYDIDLSNPPRTKSIRN